MTVPTVIILQRVKKWTAMNIDPYQALRYLSLAAVLALAACSGTTEGGGGETEPPATSGGGAGGGETWRPIAPTACDPWASAIWHPPPRCDEAPCPLGRWEVCCVDYADCSDGELCNGEC
jgi:hypothetical protein